MTAENPLGFVTVRDGGTLQTERRRAGGVARRMILILQAGDIGDPP